jgi:hypothetical protein
LRSWLSATNSACAAFGEEAETESIRPVLVGLVLWNLGRLAFGSAHRQTATLIAWHRKGLLLFCGGSNFVQRFVEQIRARIWTRSGESVERQVAARVISGGT